MRHRQAGKPHFASRIPAEFLNFLRIRKSKIENQSQPEASGAWLWFVFAYFSCFMALSVQADMRTGLLQILALLQQPPDGKRSLEILAEDAPDSKNQIHRYIRLNSLEQPLRDKVDSGELAFTPAVELSYLKPEEQQWLQNALEVTQQTPSLSQAQRIKKESKEGTLSEQGVMEIMSEEKKPLYNSVTLSHDTLKKYFPKSYTAKQMEKVIIKLLDNWLRSRQRAQER